MLPAPSRATAVSVCDPFNSPRVSHTTEYGLAVSSAPTSCPSTRNWTPATDWLSLAFAVTVTRPFTLEPPLGAVIETVGGVVSGGATVAVASFDAAPMFPAASSAATL